MGYVSWIEKKDTSDSVLTTMLLKAGAVLYVKSSVPQSMMVCEIANNIYGHTTNPRNKNLREGKYDKEVEANAKVLAESESAGYAAPQSDLEEIILQEWAHVIDMPARALGVERNMPEAGLAFIGIIKLQQTLTGKLQFCLY
ncbi:hypothetical protein BDW75DRAFT_244640 [Aspergillus navahoensis]